MDVIEPGTLAVTQIPGFPTARRKLAGHDFVLGPTAIALGRGVAYIGNRGDGRICVISASNMAVSTCIGVGASADDLASSPDGLAYVRATRELWVTLGAPPLGIMPPDNSILVLDAAGPGALAPKTKVSLDGAAEGYAVDNRRGIFYTNLADNDQTLAIDARTHRVVARWHPGCGEEGPRGLAVDARRELVFVACTDHVVVLDASRAGTQLSSFPTGSGVDNIDYEEQRGELFVAAGRSGVLTVLRVCAHGILDVVATMPTAPGSRVVVGDRKGTAYVTDPRAGRILVVRRALVDKPGRE